MKITRLICFTIISVILWSCNVTKHVPEGKHLLQKVKIHSDVKDIPVNELDDYLRQTPNSKVFGLFKMQLGIYNLAGTDSTKWYNKLFMRLGDSPVIFDQSQTSASSQQLQKLYVNKGFINAEVTEKVNLKNKKARVTYEIKSNRPYLLRNYQTNISHPLLKQIASDTARSLIRKEMHFDTDILDQERERVASRFREKGFYNFNKDFLVYKADSSLNAHLVDVTLDLRTYLKIGKDSVNDLIFKQYRIGKVLYYQNNTLNIGSAGSQETPDTTAYKNFSLISPTGKFISLNALIHNTYIEPNSLYSDLSVERTYASLNSLAPVKYVDIVFKESSDSTLDCQIVIVPAKTISLSADIEGTLTETNNGLFWGGATSLTWMNKNTFGGAESLGIQAKAALEWQNGIWAREMGSQINLRFPKFVFPIGSFDFKRGIHANTDFRTNFLYQYRPGEFTSTNVSAAVNYSWNRRRVRHNLDLLNLSYVYFPEISTDFQNNYINTGRYNRYNYENHFIMRSSYSAAFSTFNANRPMRDYSIYSFSVESAGNLLYGLNHLLNSELSADGSYKLFDIRYAQYVRGEYNVSYSQIIDKNNKFVYHMGVGLGIPYGNADIIPFERRFYSGGANSVRGWGESRLGPGVYVERQDVPTRDYNQVGDIKLDLNMEYRVKLFWMFEGALFLDGGNIWTIKDYPEQPGGAFKLDSFMNQIAIAYGAGLRMDFSFFVARLDMGVKLFNPVLSRRDQWRINPKSDDFAFHIAIGYPF
ncbi:MAG: BamA/TamA family outer membrane protein [Paludibacteraceae bacterium]|nr:BamA/TamA family outer membrane protein [Paludibacteraceae bacterium]